MRPILLSGHERALTQVKYNLDGDIIFSVSKDHVVCAWFSHNGERLGTYHGHQGALWTVDVDPTSTLLATGGADNTMRLWEVATGKLLKTWDFNTSVKRVEFSPDGRQLLAVTEKRSGHESTIQVYEINPDPEAEQSSENILYIVCEGAKATVAGFSYMAQYIISGHEDGSVTQYDAKSGELVFHATNDVHEDLITDLQWAPDRTYFITSSKDKSAKVCTLPYACATI
jgi:translation initiation factor 3 subunit I